MVTPRKNRFTDISLKPPHSSHTKTMQHRYSQIRKTVADVDDAFPWKRSQYTETCAICCIRSVVEPQLY
jgi:hypothetical protein